MSRRFSAVLLVLVAAGPATANLITFEETPLGLTPPDDAPLARPYAIDGGGAVFFFFDLDGNTRYDPSVDVLPRFEQIGKNGSADGFFSAYYSTPDTPVYDRARPGYGPQLGQYFIRQPDGIGPVPADLVIRYNTSQTIRALSGEVWDIDGAPAGTEQWVAEVLDVDGNPLLDAGGRPITETSPLGVDQSLSSLDSLPWVFSFRDLPDGVGAVRLHFADNPGRKLDGVGLAFNNFSATSDQGFVIPEPSSLALVGLGLLGLAAGRRAIGRRSS